LATSNFQIIFYGQRVGDVRVQDEKINTLQARMGTGGNNMPMLATVFPTLSATNNPSRSPQSSEVTAQIDAMVKATSTVRRLTPTECERLQGFPDGWTEGQADSHRYKQMGNAVAVPVVEWIINRMTK
jgi:DNA (cytosine-5)-methyltransferase 1